MKRACKHGWESCSMCHDKDGNLWEDFEKNNMNKEYVPDAKGHLTISLFKSALRFTGYVVLGMALPFNVLTGTAVGLLVLSEILGILEEFA